MHDEFLSQRISVNSQKRCGSTLIAAEQIGRSCCTMELDPRYAQVILNRYKEFTGKDPVKLN